MRLTPQPMSSSQALSWVREKRQRPSWLGVLLASLVQVVAIPFLKKKVSFQVAFCLFVFLCLPKRIFYSSNWKTGSEWGPCIQVFSVLPGCHGATLLLGQMKPPKPWDTYIFPAFSCLSQEQEKHLVERPLKCSCPEVCRDISPSLGSG